jgi:hypothetical protein
MTFRIFELCVGARNAKSQAIGPQFEERRDAVSHVDAMVKASPLNGYEEEQDYWWMRDTDGNLRQFIIK